MTIIGQLLVNYWSLTLQKQQCSPPQPGCLFQGAAPCLPPRLWHTCGRSELCALQAPLAPSGSPVLSAALTALVCTLCLQVSAGSQPACTGEAAGRAAGNGKADVPTVVSTAIPGPDLEANFRLMATIQRQCCSPSTFQTWNVWIGNAMENTQRKYFLLDLVLKLRLLSAVRLYLYLLKIDSVTKRRTAPNGNANMHCTRHGTFCMKEKMLIGFGIKHKLGIVLRPTYNIPD